MKRNTGCGCGSGSGSRSNHDFCPPAPPCDVADTIHQGGCNVEPFPVIADEERTIVLTDITLQTNVESQIKLPTFAREIKHIRKNVSLTQCKAIPSVLNPSTVVKLYVRGIVHKNIQYVEDCTGVVKDYGVDVEFSCFQDVTLENPIFFPFGRFSQKGSIDEVRELAKDGMGANRCTFGSATFEVFNEPIGCKLLFAFVNDLDFLENFDNWGRFNHVTEKMEVLLGIKLFQKQQDFVGPTIAPTVPPNTSGVLGASATIYDRFRNITGR
ncbi:CsxC family protein [Bacillus haimaensis]|uniref:CsxC family protein n=1 Tax=Bacillus haimaensis TaxID=3160967 RepID=UPI003AA7EA43